MSDWTGVLKAGVIGAGVFGGYHAHKYASLDGVALVGVLDADAERAQALAGKLGARPFTEAEAFFDQLDVVTIAAPATAHAALVGAALERGLHVYVEKPLAPETEEAAPLVALAKAKGLVLAVGHQERAIFAAIGLLDAPERPLRIEAVRRSSYYPGRGTDVSCGLDMMIHDYDLALALNPSAVGLVRADGRIGHGPMLDEIVTEVAFEDGMTLRAEGSRLDEGRRRTMKIAYPSGVVDIDFMAKTFSNTTGFALDADYAEAPGGKDPLGASVQAFLDAVRGTAPRPLVTGEEALRALDLALKVDAAALAVLR